MIWTRWHRNLWEKEENTKCLKDVREGNRQERSEPEGREPHGSMIRLFQGAGENGPEFPLNLSQ
jgi:hypothetical protein